MNPFVYLPESVIPCTFLKLAQGGVLGNTIVTEVNFEGILKERKGLETSGNIETKESQSTMHIRPDESFLATVGGSTIGHGMRVTKNGSTVTYRVTDQVEGYDFETGFLEFFLLTLKQESIS